MANVIIGSPIFCKTRDFQLTKHGEKYYIPHKITMPVRVYDVDCFSIAIAAYEDVHVTEEANGEVSEDAYGLIELNVGDYIYINRYYQNGDVAMLAYWVQSIGNNGIAHAVRAQFE